MCGAKKNLGGEEKFLRVSKVSKVQDISENLDSHTGPVSVVYSHGTARLLRKVKAFPFGCGVNAVVRLYPVTCDVLR